MALGEGWTLQRAKRDEERTRSSRRGASSKERVASVEFIEPRPGRGEFIVASTTATWNNVMVITIDHALL